ncbi:MAG: hypothetical protein ACYT04_84115 [Nostoc sp.]
MSTMVTELVVSLPCGTLRERGSKLRGASRREVRATPTQMTHPTLPSNHKVFKADINIGNSPVEF